MGIFVSQVDRRQTRLYRSHAAADDRGYMPGTAAERVSQVWELTREAWSFFRGGDAERRLQRDVAVFVRGKRQDLADVEKLESQLKGKRT
jgi:hypothetical protein